MELIDKLNELLQTEQPGLTIKAIRFEKTDPTKRLEIMDDCRYECIEWDGDVCLGYELVCD